MYISIQTRSVSDAVRRDKISYYAIRGYNYKIRLRFDSRSTKVITFIKVISARWHAAAVTLTYLFIYLFIYLGRSA